MPACTVKSVQDRVRVYAHLSEQAPLRLFTGHKYLRPFLGSGDDVRSPGRPRSGHRERGDRR